jgi:hypothetical protein
MPDRLEVQPRLELRQLTCGLSYSPSSPATALRPLSGARLLVTPVISLEYRLGLG